MPKFNNLINLSVALMLALGFSFASSAPAFADDSTPPDAAGAETNIETPETDPPTLTDLPEGTQIIVLDEEGEPLPLASQEADEVIAVKDPIWCPAGVTPIPGAGGCTASYPSLLALINAITSASISAPSAAGVIWIENGADASASAITINGDAANMGAWKNFSLTLQGGWAGSGSKNIIGTSDFSKSITITNWNAPIFVNDITINANAGTYGLDITNVSNNVTLKNAHATNTNAGGVGARIDNTAGTGNVVITSSSFNNSTGSGLHIDTNGNLTVANITANNNGSQYGVYINAPTTPVTKVFTFSGTNTFNNNGWSGLYIDSPAKIVINNLSAANNGGYGAFVSNDFTSSIPNGVTLTGTNTFSDNVNDGLYVASYGPIKINNLLAYSNSNSGAQLNNSGADTAQPVTLTGTNQFKFNGLLGLGVQSKGLISINNINASDNGNVGVNITNITSPTAQNVVFTGTNVFNRNLYTGLTVTTSGDVIAANVTANDNGQSSTSGSGVEINNAAAAGFKNVTFSGSNQFNNNYDQGIYVQSKGVIKLNNVTANGSITSAGAYLVNTASGSAVPKAVTLTGVNTFNNNSSYGLYVTSYGAIAANSVTANDNGQYGAYLVNAGSALPQSVTLTGANTFNNNTVYDGLQIVSYGAITTNSLTASGNGRYGVYLVNSSATGFMGVTMSGFNQISDNANSNLYISSKGAVSIANLTANGSATGNGAEINNTSGSSTKPVTLSGVNSASNNNAYGLVISSGGFIKVSSLTANGNGGVGAYLWNIVDPDAVTPAGVTVSGYGKFIGNTGGNGLEVFSLAKVTLANITASGNTAGSGLFVSDFSGIRNTGGVALTGTNVFSNNNLYGVYISRNGQNSGAVSMSNVTASGNGDDGIRIENAGSGAVGAVTLSGVNNSSNNSGGTSDGVSISTFGAVTINSLTAVSNGGGGLLIDNSGPNIVGVTLTGVNQISGNNQDNLNINTRGLVKINSLTASSSVNGYGAWINNSSGNLGTGVTLTGVNVFNNNGADGLYIDSKGAVSLGNITASFNSGTGVYITNNYDHTAPQNVTLSGTQNISNNDSTGLYITTHGAVLINSITADGNGASAPMSGGTGIELYNGMNSSVTSMKNVTFTGVNSVSNNYRGGLAVDSYGIITINSLTANGNGSATSSSGVELNNSATPFTAAAPGIKFTGTNSFNNNGYRGLFIQTIGTVALNNISANTNTDRGLYINAPTSTKPVTLTGTNSFTGNLANGGFYIVTKGAVTMNNVTASANIGSTGGIIDNSAASVPAGVTLKGINIFNDNGMTGLSVTSKGSIMLNSVTATDNTGLGIYADNAAGPAVSKVTITGKGNTFSFNGGDGLMIFSAGAVSVSNFSADKNTGSSDGLYIDTPATVKLTCGYVFLNTDYGIRLYSASSSTFDKVVIAGNSGGGIFTSGVGSAPVIIPGICP